MKKIILLLFLVSHYCANASGNSNKINRPVSDTTVIPQILSLQLLAYIGQPVDSLLNVLPQGFDKRSFMPGRIGYIKGIYQSYGTNEINICTVEIFIDTFQHLITPNYTPARNWNMNFAKLETIAFIKVVKNNVTCVYGCSNPNYY